MLGRVVHLEKPMKTVIMGKLDICSFHNINKEFKKISVHDRLTYLLWNTIRFRLEDMHTFIKKQIWISADIKIIK